MQINRLTMDNGLRLVHAYDPGTQMVAMDVAYDVGSADEAPTRTGYAHLLEHLMFEGSAHVPGFDEALQRAGGDSNAWTGTDMTNYYLTLPGDNVETGFWLESDRMMQPLLTEEKLEVQRGVVLEEYSERLHGQPYGDAESLLRSMAFHTHPYRWPTLGLTDDHVRQATSEEVRRFHRNHYIPSNAVLAVTGRITWDEARRLTEKWFGPLDGGRALPRYLPVEPPQHAVRRMEVARPVPVDALFMGYRMCAHHHADYHAFDLLSDLLSNGKSSRLQRRLVSEQRLFAHIDAYIWGSRDEGLLQIGGRLNRGVTPEQAEEAVRREVARLGEEPVDERELQKVQNKFASTLVFQRINYLNVATSLAWHELIAGDAGALLREEDAYRAVTPAQLQRVAATSLTDSHCSILHYKAEKD